MKRPQPLEGLSPKASELKRKNLLHRMGILDRKKPQLGNGLPSCSSSDGKQNESAGSDEAEGREDTKELHGLDPNRLKRMRNKRIYSRRYRLKQELKKLDLEDMHKRLVQETFMEKFWRELQENMIALPDMILHYDDRKARLKNENDELRRKLANLTEKCSTKAAQLEIRRQELRELRELYNVQQASLMQLGQQQFQQPQLMPPQAPLQPSQSDYFFLSNIFF